MNLQQLEYIIAVDECRSFVKAAEKCFVTQPTLSMMIQKLEDELDLILFDRKKSPVAPTPGGVEIIERAKHIALGVNSIREISAELSGNLSGELKIGIIPTVAPFLLPLFIKQFAQKYCSLKLKIYELTTENIIKQLEQNALDIGIAATPLQINYIKEIFLYKEEFLVYASTKEKVLKKKYILAEDIDVNHLWLLEDGHCLRSQVLNLCELRKLETPAYDIVYETGSIESLIKMVDANEGITIVPELAVQHFTDEQKECLRQFNQPVPVREISLITHIHYARKGILKAIQNEIIHNVNKYLMNKKKQRVIEI